MQKGKMQYVAAGVQDAPNMRMRVRSYVQLPDSEAGRAVDTQRQPYHAVSVEKRPRGSVTVPMRSALLLLCALFVFFGVLTIKKAAQRSEISKKISAMETAILKTERENIDLAQQVADARDSARVCDIATQKFEMRNPMYVTAEAVTAPDTRPFEQEAKAQAESIPHSAPNGIMSGSR